MKISYQFDTIELLILSLKHAFLGIFKYFQLNKLFMELRIQVQVDAALYSSRGTYIRSRFFHLKITQRAVLYIGACTTMRGIRYLFFLLDWWAQCQKACDFWTKRLTVKNFISGLMECLVCFLEQFFDPFSAQKCPRNWLCMYHRWYMYYRSTWGDRTWFGGRSSNVSQL